MLAGHDDDTPVPCNRCGALLTRDLTSIHAAKNSTSSKLQDYRTCPMPRCSFKVNHGVRLNGYVDELGYMDKLQHHLHEKHSSSARVTFIDLLRNREYEAQTGEVLCPVCPSPTCFAETKSFVEHFFRTHHRHLSLDEFRQHRRAILRIWPNFEDYPGGEDIKCPGKTD